MWIVKPYDGNMGVGIRLISSDKELQDLVQTSSQDVVQRYITTPLLVTGRKFDMRVYCLVARTSPWLLYFHSGYLRLSLDEYSLESFTDPSQRHVHLTNASVMKNHPEYEAKIEAMNESAQTSYGMPPPTAERDGSIWSMEAFAEHMEIRCAAGAAAVGSGSVVEQTIAAIAARYGGGGAFVREELPRQMKQVMVEVHKASRGKLHQQQGYFDLFGYDFMLDEQLQLHLLEVNTNPALSTDCPFHETMLPMLVEHTLEAVLHAQPVVSKMEHAKRSARTLASGEASGAAGERKLAKDAAKRRVGGFELIVDEAVGYDYQQFVQAMEAMGMTT
jgi:hypothetical protein